MQKLINALNKYHPEYTYDISRYVNARTNMSFECPVHGQFFALPTNIIRGTGCKKCAMENLFKLEQIIVDNFGCDSELHFNGHTEILSINPLDFIKTYITNTDIQLTIEYEY